MWLWGWHFYHSCLQLDGRIMFWILKNISLTLRVTLERTLEAISNQNLFCRFQSWCWTTIQKMNYKDKTFLEKLFGKESSSLIGLENFGAAGFSIIGRFEWYSKSPPIRVPPTDFWHAPHESLTPPYCYLKWDIKV